MSKTKKRNIIIGALCGVLLLMAIGYAAFQSVLNIEGTANITSNWNVLITNIEEKEKTGNVSSVKEYPRYEALKATFSVNLVSPGDSISYDVTIENQGNLDAKLESINVTDSENPAIKFETSGIEIGDVLEAGGSAILNVKITYDESVTSQPESTTSEFKATLDYVQEGHSTYPSMYTLTYEKSANVTNIGEELATCPIEQKEGCQIELPSIEVEDSNNYTGIWENELGETVGNPGDSYTITKDETLTAKRVMLASYMLKQNTTTSGDGLYNDTYEEGRYVYKGNNPNNYLTFNDEKAGWRIISVENDGIIKIMRSNTLEGRAFDTTDRITGFCYYSIQSGNHYGCNIWAHTEHFTSQPGSSGSFAGKVDGDSSLKTYLNTEYYNLLTSVAKKQIEKHKFYYGAVNYYNNDFPDQLSDEKRFYSNDNVGLIQLSDFIKANSNESSCGNWSKLMGNVSNCVNTGWMDSAVNGKSQAAWSINPDYDGDNGCSHNLVWTFCYNGYISYQYAVRSYGGCSGRSSDTSYSMGIIPSIYLKSTIRFSGKGTQNEPYTIEN